MSFFKSPSSTSLKLTVTPRKKLGSPVPSSPWVDDDDDVDTLEVEGADASSEGVVDEGLGCVGGLVVGRCFPLRLGK